MNIFFILPDLRGGGAERVCINLAHDWISRGHKVTFVLMKKRGEFLNNVSKKIKIINLNKDRIRNLFFPLVNFFLKKKPEVTLVQMWPLTSIAVLSWLASFKKGKLIIVDHIHLSTSVEKELLIPKRIFEFIINLTYKFSSKIIVVSKGVKSDLIKMNKNLSKKIKVIYNPIIHKNKKKIIKKNSLLSKKIWGKNTNNRILNVGSLKIQKDYFNLIKAFSLLKNLNKSKLLIVGDGPLKNDLKNYAQKLNLKEKIFFVNFKKNLDVFYQTADLFVVSSMWEGFSNVIVESLGFGLPVVSTNCKSGPSEILKNGKYGTLVPIQKPFKLSEAIFKNLKKKHNKEKLINRSLDFQILKISNQYLKLIKYE